MDLFRTVRGQNQSWAALSTCEGLVGIFHDGTEMFHIEKVPDLNATVDAGDISGQHYLYKHSGNGQFMLINQFSKS